MPAKTKARRSKAGKRFLIDFHGRIVGPHLFHLPAKNTLHARVGLGK